jgi:hypothetical protein
MLVGAVAFDVRPARADDECQLVVLRGHLPLDGFGRSVSVDGRRMVTPSVQDEDYDYYVVQVFERSGAAWIHVADILPDDPQPVDGFGHAPQVKANRIVVGAPWDNWDGKLAGAAYVFRLDGSAWVQEAKLTASDGDYNDWFGEALAASGDTVAVGAAHAQAIYVFDRAGDGTWSQVAKLLPTDPPYFYFGEAVAFDGDIIVGGSPYDDDQGNYAGAAYIFERSAGCCWTLATKVVGDDTRALDSFGESVAVSGNTVLVGAPGADTDEPSTGAGYVFERQVDGTWLQTAKLTASDGENSDWLGSAVALDGDVALLGATEDDDIAPQVGAAYVFTRGVDGSWSEVAKLVPHDGESWDDFGRSVSVSGNIGAIGTYPYDVNEPWKPGKAYIYAVGPDEDGDGVMDACECAGDLNHDWIVDYHDLLVLLDDWRCTGGDCPGDADADGDTDQSDLGLLLAYWGEICP